MNFQMIRAWQASLTISQSSNFAPLSKAYGFFGGVRLVVIGAGRIDQWIKAIMMPYPTPVFDGRTL